MKRRYLIICLSPLMTGLMSSCNNLPTDTFIDLDTVKVCTSEDEASFNFIISNELGLTVRNYYHENIYRYSAKTAPGNQLMVIVKSCVVSFQNTTLTLVITLTLAMIISVKAIGTSTYSPAQSSHHQCGADQVEGEVTPPLSLRSISFFPTEGNEGGCPLIGKPIAIYGPWVSDVGHDNQREIHPAEAIWWRNSASGNADIELILLQDAACNRFDDRSFYDFDEDGDGQPDSEPL